MVDYENIGTNEIEVCKEVLITPKKRLLNNQSGKFTLKSVLLIIIEQ